MFWEKIKSFFASLAFWRDKPQPLPEPNISKPKPPVTDDGQGGEIQEPKKPLPLDGRFPIHYRYAYKEVGTREIRGSNHNPRVLEYHMTSGGFSDDETPWCASFVNWCLIQRYWNKESGVYIYKGIVYQPISKDMKRLATLVGTGKPNARSFSAKSFTDKHKTVSRKEAQVGDIVVLWRGSRSGWMGHVGFVAGFVGDEVKILGGNQSNAVNIRNYPMSRVLEFVRV